MTGTMERRGKPREKKKKLTKEDMQRVNHENKFRRARHRLLKYFKTDDYFITWTFEMSKRPESMKEAVDLFGKAIGYVRKEYRKRGYELFWIRNIERGTKGAWHIHVVLNNIGVLLLLPQMPGSMEGRTASR